MHIANIGGNPINTGSQQNGKSNAPPIAQQRAPVTGAHVRAPPARNTPIAIRVDASQVKAHPVLDLLAARFPLSTTDGLAEPAGGDLHVAFGEMSGRAAGDTGMATLEVLLASGTALLVLEPTDAFSELLKETLGYAPKRRHHALYIARVSATRHRSIGLGMGVQHPSTPGDKESIYAGGHFGMHSVIERPLAKPAPTEPSWGAFVDEVAAHLLERGTPVDYRPSPFSTNIPPEIVKWEFTHTAVETWRIDNDLDQYASASLDFHVGLYLNDPKSGENYQYIYLRHDARLSPGALTSDTGWKRGYFQDRFDIQMSIQDDNIVMDQSSPKNVVQETEVTDSVNFAIGYTTSEGGSSEFNYQHSETRIIKDWEIIETSRLSNASWIYTQNLPYNAYKQEYASGFNVPYVGFGVKDMPPLSKFTNQPDTQAVWRTKKVLQSKINLAWRLDHYATLLDTGFAGLYPGGKFRTNTFGDLLTIDLNKVQPKPQR